MRLTYAQEYACHCALLTVKPMTVLLTEATLTEATPLHRFLY